MLDTQRLNQNNVEIFFQILFINILVGTTLDTM